MLLRATTEHVRDILKRSSMTFDLARLKSESRILEIGPGTGKATEPLARRGFAIHGIELGPSLAREARANLKLYPEVQSNVGAFESFPLEARAYDLIFSATAFHWLQQPIGYQRVAEALNSGGYFAEFRHHHVWSPESDRFVRNAQDVYLQFDPDASPGFRLPLPEDVETLDEEIRVSGFFEKPEIRRYLQNIEHTPESYIELLLTFSGHIALHEPNKTNLLRGIADVIRRLPGGRVVKTHLILLHVARLKG